MNIIKEQISSYKDKIRKYLRQEETANGKFDVWFNELSEFRAAVFRSYFLANKGGIYINIDKKNNFGDLIDHHISSCFAPFDLTNKGFNGLTHTAVEQVRVFSDYFHKKGKRFIYVCLPNKGFLYPDLICEDANLYSAKTMVAPQWRKYVSDIIDTDVEIIDIYPVFKTLLERKESEALFAKGHYLSPFGAKIVADEIASYLKKTTKNISENVKIEQDVISICDNSAGDMIKYKSYLNFTIENSHKEIYYHHNDDKKDITIFGDCNLQAYLSIGSGISANLAYNLQHHINDDGRVLIFDDKRQKDNTISFNKLEKISKSDIIIYVAFGSASFVRSSCVSSLREYYRNCFFSKFSWCKLNI